MFDINTLPKEKCAGIVVFDKIDKDYIVLMGSKIKNGERVYEYFGGGNEPEDYSAVHTATRELVEEMFNIKISKKEINELTKIILKENDIRHDITLVHKNHNNNLTYFIGFEALEKIYNYLKYGKYELIEHFDLIKYMKNRKINGMAYDGLNEIDRIHLRYLKDVPNLKLRNVAKRITEYMLKKL